MATTATVAMPSRVSSEACHASRAACSGPSAGSVSVAASPTGRSATEMLAMSDRDSINWRRPCVRSIWSRTWFSRSCTCRMSPISVARPSSSRYCDSTAGRAGAGADPRAAARRAPDPAPHLVRPVPHRQDVADLGGAAQQLEVLRLNGAQVAQRGLQVLELLGHVLRGRGDAVHLDGHLL